MSRTLHTTPCERASIVIGASAKSAVKGIPLLLRAVISIRCGCCFKQQPQRIEITARSKSGIPFTADFALAPITIDARSQGVVCSVRDISNLKQVEADLRTSLESYGELR